MWEQRTSKPMAGKPKMPNSPDANSAVWLSLLNQSLGSGFNALWPRFVGSANQSSRFKSRQRLQLHLRPKLQTQAPKGAQDPVRASGQCEGRWTGVTHLPIHSTDDQCPMLFLQINEARSVKKKNVLSHEFNPWYQQ